MKTILSRKFSSFGKKFGQTDRNIFANIAICNLLSDINETVIFWRDFQNISKHFRLRFSLLLDSQMEGWI